MTDLSGGSLSSLVYCQQRRPISSETRALATTVTDIGKASSSGGAIVRKMLIRRVGTPAWACRKGERSARRGRASSSRHDTGDGSDWHERRHTQQQGRQTAGYRLSNSSMTDWPSCFEKGTGMLVNMKMDAPGRQCIDT